LGKFDIEHFLLFHCIYQEDMEDNCDEKKKKENNVYLLELSIE